MQKKSSPAKLSKKNEKTGKRGKNNWNLLKLFLLCKVLECVEETKINAKCNMNVVQRFCMVKIDIILSKSKKTEAASTYFVLLPFTPCKKQVH